MDYTWLDFIIILIFFINIALGAARGIFQEAVSMISIIIALVVTIKYTVSLSDFLVSSQGFKDVVSTFGNFTKYNTSAPLSLIAFGVSFLTLFFVPYFLGEGVNYYASNIGMLVVFPTLAILERLIGGAMGYIRGYLFSMILILVMGLTPLIKDDGYTKSTFIPQIMPKALQLGNMVRRGGFPIWS